MREFFDKSLKGQRLPTGFFVIRGAQGAGKTSLGTALLSIDYKYHGEERLKLAQAEVNRLNALGHKLKLPKHLYYSNIEQSINGRSIDDNKRVVRTHYLTSLELGLPNSDYKVQYFPPYSVAYISEADLLLYCQDWQRISKYLWNMLRYVRHNKMTVIFEVQEDTALAIQLRRLVTDFIWVEKKVDVKPRFFGLIKANTLWFFTWEKPKVVAQLERQKGLGYNGATKDAFRDMSFKYSGKIFTQFDSFSAQMYFLNGIDENGGYTVKEHPLRDYTIEGIKKYCNAMPLSAPKSKEEAA